MRSCVGTSAPAPSVRPGNTALRAAAPRGGVRARGHARANPGQRARGRYCVAAVDSPAIHRHSSTAAATLRVIRCYDDPGRRAGDGGRGRRGLMPWPQCMRLAALLATTTLAGARTLANKPNFILFFVDVRV